MNKEEIKKMFSVLTEQWGDTDNYVNDLLCYSKELQKENKQLEKCLEINHKIIDIYVERIDKATELLKLAQESGLISISTLMKILKGDRQ